MNFLVQPQGIFLNLIEIMILLANDIIEVNLFLRAGPKKKVIRNTLLCPTVPGRDINIYFFQIHCAFTVQ